MIRHISSRDEYRIAKDVLARLEWAQSHPGSQPHPNPRAQQMLEESFATEIEYLRTLIAEYERTTSVPPRSSGAA